VRPRLESSCKGRHHPVRRAPPALPEAAGDPRKRFSAKRRWGSGDRAARARGLFLVAEVDAYRLPPRLTAKGRVPGDAPRKRAEGARVDGRHPGPRRPWSLTRPRRRRAWRFSSSFGGASALPGKARRRDRGCQRSRRKLDSRPKTPRTGGAVRRVCRSQNPPGPNGARPPLVFVVRGLSVGRGRLPRATVCDQAEARASPSSEAPLDVSVGGSGPLRIAPNQEAARPLRGRSRTNQAAGCSCRRSVAEIGETHLSLPAKGARARREASQGKRG